MVRTANGKRINALKCECGPRWPVPPIGSCSSLWMRPAPCLKQESVVGGCSDSSGCRPSEPGSFHFYTPGSPQLATMLETRWRGHVDKSHRKRPHGEGEALKLHGEKENTTPQHPGWAEPRLTAARRGTTSKTREEWPTWTHPRL